MLANELFHGSSRHSEGEGWAVRHAQRLVAKASGVAAPFGQAADAALTGGLDATWRIGWQPMDIWQVFRRRLDDEVAEFIVGAIAAEAVRYPAAASHPRWRAQLVELGARQWWPQDKPYAEAWAERAGIDTVSMLALVLEALAHLRVLQPEPELIPPPGSYSGPGPGSGSPLSSVAGEVDPKVLAKVRALLAKAESTEFPEEADAFFAKASGEAAPFGQAADAALTGGLDATWRIGWQPMDIWQVFRRRLDDEVAEFIVGAIAAEAVRYPAAASHPRWR
ncbi:MAG: hypothetical protein QOI50_832, partial [Pseudonocardiales bacterium]|nr:hypothetical protein [Pseudonocardiales bacterium]